MPSRASRSHRQMKFSMLLRRLAASIADVDRLCDRQCAASVSYGFVEGLLAVYYRFRLGEGWVRTLVSNSAS